MISGAVFPTRVTPLLAVTGDLSQVDLPRGMQSGLAHALSVIGALNGTSVVEFADVDVVRHRLVTKIVKAYDAHEREHAPHGDMRWNSDNARKE